MEMRCSSILVAVLAAAVFCLLAAPQPILAQEPADTNTTASETAEQLFRKILNESGEWIKGKYSTPGVSAEVRALPRLGNPTAPGKEYGVRVTGAPKGETYSLLVWPITAAEPALQKTGITINPDGSVICLDGTPLNLVTATAPGEILRLELLSDDYTVKIYFTVVPDPIIKKSRGCSLEALRLMPNFELALIRGKGFAANDAVELDTKTFEESQVIKGMADANGDYFSALLPFVKDKKKGKMVVKLKGASCEPELSFEWGK
jgi:hypothetical protein